MKKITLFFFILFVTIISGYSMIMQPVKVNFEIRQNFFNEVISKIKENKINLTQKPEYLHLSNTNKSYNKFYFHQEPLMVFFPFDYFTVGGCDDINAYYYVYSEKIYLIFTNSVRIGKLKYNANNAKNNEFERIYFPNLNFP